ncbi:hypothetical protein BHE74_00003691 [Ensete ventricosum]|nr:hypothetical protein BHE74_00003691 [Ensete ventricosum]
MYGLVVLTGRMSSGRKPGDWVCRSCQYVNFCRRDSCQRCGELKLGVERADYTSVSGSWDVKPGDWYCSCGVHNYASRSNCFKCGATKDDSTSAVAQSWGFRCSGAWSSGWKSGDWICTRYITPPALSTIRLQRTQLCQQDGMFPMQCTEGLQILSGGVNQREWGLSGVLLCHSRVVALTYEMEKGI